MTKFRILIALVVVILIGFSSCTKETILQDSTKTLNEDLITATTFEKSGDGCGEIDELCVGPIVPHTVKVHFNDGSDIYALTTIPNNGEYVEIGIMHKKGDYVLSNNPSRYAQSFSSEISLPKGISKIANLNIGNWNEGKVNLDQIKNAFGEGYDVRYERGSYYIDANGKDTDGGDIQGYYYYNWCSYVIPKTVDRYKEHLMGAFDVLTNDETLNEIIEEAILECTPNLCEECTDTECAIDKIINDPSISGANLVIDEIKRSYLTLFFDVDESVFADLSSGDLQDMYYGLDNNLITYSDCSEPTNSSPIQLPSCPDAFPIDNQISNAYYVQSDFINFGFWSGTTFFKFCIPHLCIEVPFMNSSNQLYTPEEASLMIAQAFDEARKSLYNVMQNGGITSDAQAKVEFVDILEQELADAFGVNVANVSVNQTECTNDALSGDYAIALPGQIACFPAIGECHW